jgi:hypothetical protein
MRSRGLVVLLVAVLAAGAAASTARADGDPASDYLLVQKVFYPFEAKLSAAEKAQFGALVDAANRSGFPIRVAMIGGVYDMGSVTSLYRKPRTYARFLGAELSYYYKQRLLVVMPNGFGFNWPKHPSAPAYRVLAGIRIGPGSAGMLAAARTAVEKLAAADGVKVAPPRTPTASSRNNRDRIVIVVAVTLVAIGLGVVLQLRRRRVG